MSDSTQPKQFTTALDVANHAGYRLDELTALFCAIKELAEEDTFARTLASLGMDLADRSSVELSRIGDRLRGDCALTPSA
jgi:hypothetical protein